MKPLVRCGLPAIGLLLAALGCGKVPPPEVTGQVTLDGQPLGGALITFAAADDPSGVFVSTVTDPQGTYRLPTDSQPSAVPGRYRVRITTGKGGHPEASPPIPAVPELVPIQYNLRTELTADVKPGPNRIDFPLDSAGEIMQPDEL
ncbi:MAG: carboxypeptidase regulatory-like domain-containing protein [Pirellulaceae bacterium]|nr:carboxypeptidase regulatory-like domain-containing protein [Pirellulaceae bacterium]